MGIQTLTPVCRPGRGSSASSSTRWARTASPWFAPAGTRGPSPLPYPPGPTAQGGGPVGVALTCCTCGSGCQAQAWLNCPWCPGCRDAVTVNCFLATEPVASLLLQNDCGLWDVSEGGCGIISSSAHCHGRKGDPGRCRGSHQSALLHKVSEGSTGDYGGCQPAREPVRDAKSSLLRPQSRGEARRRSYSMGGGSPSPDVGAPHPCLYHSSGARSWASYLTSGVSLHLHRHVCYDHH